MEICIEAGDPDSAGREERAITHWHSPRQILFLFWKNIFKNIHYITDLPDTGLLLI